MKIHNNGISKNNKLNTQNESSNFGKRNWDGINDE